MKFFIWKIDMLIIKIIYFCRLKIIKTIYSIAINQRGHVLKSVNLNSGWIHTFLVAEVLILVLLTLSINCLLSSLFNIKLIFIDVIDTSHVVMINRLFLVVKNLLLNIIIWYFETSIILAKLANFDAFQLKVNWFLMLFCLKFKSFVILFCQSVSSVLLICLIIYKFNFLFK